MLDILLKFFMFIINTFCTILLTPITSLLVNAFPSITSIFSVLINVFDWGFDLLGFFLELFMIPQNILIIYMAVSAAILVFNLAIRGYAFVMAAYHYFKL